MNEAQVVRSVHEFFHKEFGVRARKTFCTECWRGDWGGRADLTFIVSRSDGLNIVEAKATLEGAFKAIDQVQRYPANKWWIALPEEEYVSGAGLLKACAEEGIGVLLVHDRWRKPVEVKRWPAYQTGNFLSEWPRLEGEWHESG